MIKKHNMNESAKISTYYKTEFKMVVESELNKI